MMKLLTDGSSSTTNEIFCDIASTSHDYVAGCCTSLIVSEERQECKRVTGSPGYEWGGSRCLLADYRASCRRLGPVTAHSLHSSIIIVAIRLVESRSGTRHFIPFAPIVHSHPFMPGSRLLPECPEIANGAAWSRFERPTGAGWCFASPAMSQPSYLSSCPAVVVESSK